MEVALGFPVPDVDARCRLGLFCRPQATSNAARIKLNKPTINFFGFITPPSKFQPADEHLGRSPLYLCKFTIQLFDPPRQFENDGGASEVNAEVAPEPLHATQL